MRGSRYRDAYDNRADLDTQYDTRKPLKSASFTIDDFHGKRRILSLPEVFIYSSNIGAAKMGLRLGKQRVYQVTRPGRPVSGCH